MKKGVVSFCDTMFKDMSKIDYKAPPISKNFEPKKSLVHTQISIKNKTNVEHLSSISR